MRRLKALVVGLLTAVLISTGAGVAQAGPVEDAICKIPHVGPYPYPWRFCT